MFLSFAKAILYFVERPHSSFNSQDVNSENADPWYAAHANFSCISIWLNGEAREKAHQKPKRSDHIVQGRSLSRRHDISWCIKIWKKYIYRIIRKRFLKSLFQPPKNQQKNWRDILLLTQVCTLFLIYFDTIMSANCKCRKSKYFFPWNDDQNIWKKPKHRANWSEKNYTPFNGRRPRHYN